MDRFTYLLISERWVLHKAGMHLFLYQAARHIKPSYGYRRLSQNTIRCDFDLELLKRGIKGRYEILGHGTHPFQNLMKQMGMEEEFYGHVIAIEDSKNAVWFKLNYDNIGRNVTKYMGGWRDLNPEDLAPHVHQYQLLEQISKSLYLQISSIRSQYLNTNNFVNKTGHPLGDGAIAAGRDYLAALKDAETKLSEHRDEQVAKMASLQDQVRAYMKEHKG